MTGSKPKSIPNGEAIDALDFDGLTEKQLETLDRGIKAQRQQRAGVRNIDLAERVAGLMPPQSSDAPLSER